ncbi:MAG: hypothetical protein JW827_00830 [Spirochaetes bacterium]|nr:hypothetical protein [Spirochaetota bacterium]
MSFSKIILFLLILITPAFLLCESGLKPRIAVLDLEAKGVTEDEAGAVTDFLRTDLVNTKEFTVIERARMKDVLKEQQMSLSGLTETEKAARVGKILNCRLIMVGSLSKLGEKYFLNVRVVDVETTQTSLGKRESSDKLEELSDVSKSIAYQLAGMDYKQEEIEQIEMKEKIRSPAIGFDFRFNITRSINRDEDIDEQIIHAWPEPYTTNSGTTRYKSEKDTDPSLSDLRFNAFLGGLYLGIGIRTVTVEKGMGSELVESVNNNPSLSQKINETREHKIRIKDLMLGLRGWTPGRINPRIIYFTWRTISEEYTDPVVKQEFYGPGLGIVLRNPAPSKKKDALELISYLELHFSYLWLNKSDIVLQGSHYGILGGGEFGLGLQLKRLGLYCLLTYSLDVFYTAYDYKEDMVSGNIIYSQSKDGSRKEVFKGILFRLGYTFDMQALFR